jgi:prepilin-type N-terminal cleavage/methylation domain-containing protein
MQGVKGRRQINTGQGFTIVELLIVIVVVGILATITIVAYNGIQSRAQIAVLKSDLETTAKSLESYRISSATERYPEDIDCSSSPASNTTCVRTGQATTLAYLYDTSLNSYCVTGTNSGNAYSISSANPQPTSGGCIITNFVVNPSLESSSAGWSTNASMDPTRVQVGGKWVYRGTRNTVGATGIYASRNLPSTVEANTVYTASATVTSSITTTVNFSVRRAGTTTDIFSTTANLSPNVPQRISLTGSVGPWTSVYIGITTSTGASGDWITVDEVMLTKGSPLYPYADGNSVGWSWSGTPNESSSSGPAL